MSYYIPIHNFFVGFVCLFQVTRVNSEHKNWTKMLNIALSFPKGSKKPCPKPSAGARRKPTLRAVLSIIPKLQN